MIFLDKFNLPKCLKCGSKDLEEVGNDLVIAEKESLIGDAKDFLEISLVKCNDCGYIHLFTN